MTTTTSRPPMDPRSSEADEAQLAMAKAQGATYLAALSHMANDVADTGGMREHGDYLVAYAIEEAEGMYEFHDGELVWHNPGDQNAHVEIAVCDAADGRLIPGLDVSVTIEKSSGESVGTFDLPLLWHPMMYHYGTNVHVPDDGEYTLKVHAEPPRFMRHDEVNGRRFTEPIDLEFANVPIERGSEPVTPPQ